MYDLIIIGGGPTGLSCAIEAGQKGLNYLVLEKGLLVNSLYNFPTNMTFFSTSKKLEIGKIPFISHHDKPTRSEALEYYRRLQEAWDIRMNLYEEVTEMTREKGDTYTISTTKSEYQAQSVIIATGFYDTPRLLNVPGEDLPKVKHFYDDAHQYIGQKIVVVGAANSACDVALETYQKGAEVTMVIRGKEIYPKVKYWIRPNIENRIKESSIKAYFKTNICNIRSHEVDLETPDGRITIANDFVLAMTGYMPNYTFLSKLGLTFTKDADRFPIYDEATLETEQVNVYVAGVIAAGMQTSKLFIENTRHHGELIIANILAKKATI